MNSRFIQRRHCLCLLSGTALSGMVSVCQNGLAAPVSLPQDAVDEMSSRLIHMGGYDLESEDLGSYPVKSWEGLPTRLFAYQKKDPDGTKKRGLAVMLNPASETVARWIVQAVIEVRGSYDVALARTLARQTRHASGFQFVVRGIHWEKMEPSPVHVAYPFRDGVTVKLRRFGQNYPTQVLKEADLRYAVDCGEEEVTFTGKYARIQSTQREDYQAIGGSRDTSEHKWRDVVRDLYKAAWGQNRNELMVAKARAIHKPATQ